MHKQVEYTSLAEEPKHTKSYPVEHLQLPVSPSSNFHLKDLSTLRNSYTMPTKAVWDLLPEPEGEGNRAKAINPIRHEGAWYNYFKAYYGNACALL